MSRVTPEEESRLDYVAVIADPENPTATELNAGVPLTRHAMSWNFPETGNTTDTSDMSSKFNKQGRGTRGGDSATLPFYRDDEPAEDVAWDTLPEDTEGYLVERIYGGTETAYAAAQKVNIYGGAVNTRVMRERTRNTPLAFDVSWVMEKAPLKDVTVAAGA